METLILPYNYKKLYYRLSVTLIALSLFVYGYSTIQLWNVISIVCCILLGMASLFYCYMRFKTIRNIPYFLKCDESGIYTHECFTFCPWNNVKGIELKRYLGYQTLFFVVNETNLTSKIKAFHQNGKQYYCLPLADCKGKVKENYAQILNFYNNK